MLCQVHAVVVADMLPCILQMNYNNKNNLMGALLVAGFDQHKGGQVTGPQIELRVAAAGSSSWRPYMLSAAVLTPMTASSDHKQPKPAVLVHDSEKTLRYLSCYISFCRMYRCRQLGSNHLCAGIWDTYRGHDSRGDVGY